MLFNDHPCHVKTDSMGTESKRESEYKTLNPTTEKVEKVFAEATDAEVWAALDKAQHVYEHDWRHQAVADRAAIMAKAALIFREKSEHLSSLMTVEMGKLLPQARFALLLCLMRVHY